MMWPIYFLRPLFNPCYTFVVVVVPFFIFIFTLPFVGSITSRNVGNLLGNGRCHAHQGLESILLSNGHIRSTKVRIVLLNCVTQKLMTETAFKISLQEPVSVWFISKFG